jgi:hypothetical protein
MITKESPKSVTNEEIKSQSLYRKKSMQRNSTQAWNLTLDYILVTQHLVLPKFEMPNNITTPITNRTVITQFVLVPNPKTSK